MCGNICVEENGEEAKKEKRKQRKVERSKASLTSNARRKTE